MVYGMTNLVEIKAVWGNWPGAPGYSTFYFDTAQTTAPASVRAFFDAIKALLPTGLTVQVAGSGDIIDDITGRINNSWTAAAPAVVTGTAVASYSGGSGGLVHWITSTVINGRRLRARTFLVPLTAGAYDNNGSLSSSTITTLQTAANGLLTAESGLMRAWHRPTNFSGGSSGAVSSASVPDLAVSLRSRRV
jgi:hypothetical protein